MGREAIPQRASEELPTQMHPITSAYCEKLEGHGDFLYRASENAPALLLMGLYSFCFYLSLVANTLRFVWLLETLRPS